MMKTLKTCLPNIYQMREQLQKDSMRQESEVKVNKITWKRGNTQWSTVDWGGGHGLN